MLIPEREMPRARLNILRCSEEKKNTSVFTDFKKKQFFEIKDDGKISNESRVEAIK